MLLSYFIWFQVNSLAGLHLYSSIFLIYGLLSLFHFHIFSNTAENSWASSLSVTVLQSSEGFFFRQYILQSLSHGSNFPSLCCITQIKMCFFIFGHIPVYTVKASSVSTVPDVTWLISLCLIQRLVHPSVFRWSIFRVWEERRGFVVRQQLQEEGERLVCIAAVSLWQRADVHCDCLVVCLFLLRSSCSWSWNITVILNIHPV